MNNESQYEPSDINLNRLVYNAIRTPDGTLLESNSVQDYKEHKDSNGYTYMVDGGLSYLRRILNTEAPAEELSMYEDSPQHEIGKALKWGTYGINGDQPLEWKSLRDMSVDHLQACIKNVPCMRDVLRSCMLREISWRESDANTP